jgi:two-component system cell cycle response regulator DivK
MADLANRSALIIEDNPGDTKVLQSLLSRIGVTYLAIDPHNILSGLSQAAIPDVIFLDLEMPEMNGYEVLAELQASPDFDGVPVVAYTSHTSQMAAAREAGFNGFLGKPLVSGEFAKQLEEIINGGSVWEVR